MKKILSLLMLAVLSLALLTACTDGPLVATATPEPTPQPTPQPTPEMIFQENVYWPEEGLATLLPHFQPQLETLSTRGEELFFASFTEADTKVIDNYRQALKDAGFTDITEESEMIFAAALEGTEGLLKVQVFYDGGAGTIQISDTRE